jgi:hypothetical protein
MLAGFALLGLRLRILDKAINEAVLCGQREGDAILPEHTPQVAVARLSHPLRDRSGRYFVIQPLGMVVAARGQLGLNSLPDDSLPVLSSGGNRATG